MEKMFIYRIKGEGNGIVRANDEDTAIRVVEDSYLYRVGVEDIIIEEIPDYEDVICLNSIYFDEDTDATAEKVNGKENDEPVTTFKDFMDLYDNWNGVTRVNDDNLDPIIEGVTSGIMYTRKDLYDKEVVAFEFFGDEGDVGTLAVRVKNGKERMEKDMKNFTIEYDKLQKMFERYIASMRRKQNEAPGTYDDAWFSGVCEEMEVWLSCFGVDVSYSRIQPMVDGKSEIKMFDEEPDFPWYTENWYNEDLETALENNDVPVTPENVAKLREACRGIFDDKSARNEMIDDKAREIFDEEDESQEVEITMEKVTRVSKTVKVTPNQMEQLKIGLNPFADEMVKEMESGSSTYDYAVNGIDGEEIVTWGE